MDSSDQICFIVLKTTEVPLKPVNRENARKCPVLSFEVQPKQLSQIWILK